ncbi:MAG: hypothetical protein Q6K80_06170 [Thermostichus sp. DG_1_6_bins_120]
MQKSSEYDALLPLGQHAQLARQHKTRNNPCQHREAEADGVNPQADVRSRPRHLRLNHSSIRTEQALVNRIKPSIPFHHLRHPVEMGVAEGKRS